jgi:hypothetical protein
MNRLLKALGYRGREYRGGEFRVRIKPIVREVLSVTYTRHGATLALDGQRIGRKWEGIEVHIPQEIEGGKAAQIARDLEAAFQAMGYGYVIARLERVEVVNEGERQTAIAELRNMGYEVEVSTDRKQIRQKPIPGVPRNDRETLRRQVPHMMALLQAIHGTRQHFQILAKSKEF